MAKIGLHFDPSPDGQRLTFRATVDDHVVAQTDFDAGMVDELLRAVASCRVRMVDQIPLELDPGARIETIVAPVYSITALQEAPGTTMLSLRHPGFGWLGYHFTPERCHKLGVQLQMSSLL